VKWLNLDQVDLINDKIVRRIIRCDQIILTLKAKQSEKGNVATSRMMEAKVAITSTTPIPSGSAATERCRCRKVADGCLVFKQGR
jgi:hypothetical protein